MTEDEKLTMEAINWIHRNNYDLQCLLKAGELKQAFVEAYKAGTLSKHVPLTGEELDAAIQDRLDEDDLISISDLEP